MVSTANCLLEGNIYKPQKNDFSSKGETAPVAPVAPAIEVLSAATSRTGRERPVCSFVVPIISSDLLFFLVILYDIVLW